MKLILSYFKPHIPKVGLCLFIKICGIVFEIFIPILLSYIIDDIVPNKDLIVIFLYGMLMILCSVGGFFGNCKANQIAAGIARKITINLRQDLFTKIMSLDQEQLDEVTIPSLVARMSSDTYNIHQMNAMILRLGVRAPVLLIGGMIATFVLDSHVALVILSTLPFVVLTLYLVSKISFPYFKQTQNAIDKMVQSLRENITGIRVIKALSKEDYEKERFDKVNKKVIEYELKSGITMATLNPVINIILNVGLVFVIVVGAIRVNDGVIEAGKVLSFTTFFTMMLNAVIALNRMITIITKAYASNLRITYIFNISKKIIKIDSVKTSKAFIEFNDVTFSYLGKKDNLSNISFTLEEGKSLGIIGATGSGKTTIINLLLRLYDPNNGTIYVNHQDIKSYDNQKLKSYFGTSLQHDNLFSDTIYNNIDFFRDLNKDDIDKAIKCACATFLYDLKDGLNFVLAPKGTNLSGGQRQRVILARALCANPKILILDDATSALDYKTDATFRQNLKKYYPNTTIIIISGRVSSVINCHLILVIDEGKLIGKGSHQELLLNNTIYKEIYASQMGGDIYE